MVRLLSHLSDKGLSVLAYHRVMAAHDPLRPGEPTAEQFEARMRWVASNFTVLPLLDAVRALREERLPPRALSITFDDGYADNHDLALPVLRKLGLPATFFIATGYLEGGCMFNDTVIEAVRGAPGPTLDLRELGFGVIALGADDERAQALGRILDALKYELPPQREEIAAQIARRAAVAAPAQLMMTAKQVKAVHETGMTIGAHTVTHPILAKISLDRARKEIVDSRARLEQITGAPVRLFAYPNGRPGRDYRREHAALARELGFEAAVTTAPGAAGSGGDLYQIPRFTPWDRPNWRFGLRLMRNRFMNPALA
jgi:peptidoglycan/xylan/chitin deacetylase (PgdA/CDA1 family)